MRSRAQQQLHPVMVQFRCSLDYCVAVVRSVIGETARSGLLHDGIALCRRRALKS